MSRTNAGNEGPTPLVKRKTKAEQAAEIRELKASVEAVIAEHAPLMGEIGSEIAQLKRERRQHAGVANQITVLHSKHSALERMLKQLQDTVSEIKADPTSPNFELVFERDKLEEALADSQEIGALASEIKALRSRINEVDKKVDKNHAQINDRVDDTDRRLGHVTHRVHLLEQIRDKLPLWQLGVGAGFGLIVFIILLAQTFVVPEITIADGSTLGGDPNPIMNSFWWKAGVGLGVFAGVTGLLIVIGSFASAANRSMKTHKETTWQTPVPPVDPNATMPSLQPSSSSENEAATKPLRRTSSGVASSPR